MRSFKVIVFDWDGTLVNSTGRIINSMHQAAKEHGLPPQTDAAVQNIIGLGLPEAITALWPNIEQAVLNSMIPSYARYFLSESEVGMEMYAGARALLEQLKADGYWLAVATGKSRKGLDRMMHDLNLGHLFMLTRCADETRSKPHPQMLQELLEAFGVEAQEALMIGDSTYDLDMARAIGVASIGMTHGAHDAKRLQASQPLALCDNIQQLQQWIELHG